MQRVLVLDKNRQPLMPCHPARARELLREGKAAVFRRFPFTIILKDRTGGAVQDVCLKLNPGSRVTGLALVAQFIRRGSTVIWAGELAHRGAAIRKALEQRRGHRRLRRAHLRYRAPRFDNRTKPEGWLAPSLQHRVDTTMTWVCRLRQWVPVTNLSTMLHRFDTQALQNPEISGVEYQQGELQGYEVREYLLEKWGRQCAYCDAEHAPLTIDHIHPTSRGGSDRVSNLTLACFPCNQRKSNRPLTEFLAHDPKRLARIEAQRKAPLRDAAAVNSTRWALFGTLKKTGLPVEVGTGGRTKYNRVRQGYVKAHWIDAACVGKSGDAVSLHSEQRSLAIEAMGHGERQRTRLNRHGFPVGHKTGTKSFSGFQTGDLVRARVLKGKHAGIHVGRVAIRFRPSFALKTAADIFDVHPKYLSLIQRSDGYAYQ
ncbi:RNA-guided endonuclease IscB [Acidiferrobacter thiooxydans]|jgi:5-methylcytosine-specific restriction endonuclease McrA|uniref:HNH endonuclease n=1 Tax=Acidiferrobacter thiooxydans TaxID=163359 RepID=A0A368HCN7_9GAMM|nr:RNA-guided endonuclease IscB [Gammaproteobacteria bacterium]RCN56205.1 HNH endonuclease [Acidiferrobacter thiooxydans]